MMVDASDRSDRHRATEPARQALLKRRAQIGPAEAQDKQRRDQQRDDQAEKDETRAAITMNEGRNVHRCQTRPPGARPTAVSKIDRDALLLPIAIAHWRQAR